MNKFKLSLLTLVAVLALSQVALADTINGSVGGGGGNVTWTSTSVTLPSANAIVLTSSGDLSGLGFESPVTISGSLTLTAGAPDQTITFVDGGETATLVLTSISIVSETPYGSAGDSVLLHALGNLTLTGGPTSGPTVALFSLSATEEPGSSAYSFDLASPAPPTTVTPEPSSLLFLGTGLLGMAFVVFRKNNSTKQSNMFTNL